MLGHFLIMAYFQRELPFFKVWVFSKIRLPTCSFFVVAIFLLLFGWLVGLGIRNYTPYAQSFLINGIKKCFKHVPTCYCLSASHMAHVHVYGTIYCCFSCGTCTCILYIVSYHNYMYYVCET